MRTALALPFTCLLAVAAALSGVGSTAWARAAVATPAPPPAVAIQMAIVAKARNHSLWPAYPAALFELAQQYQRAKMLKPALEAALTAALVYDRQLELHHDLSESVTDASRGRAERAAARELGLARDRARFLAAQLAEKAGDPDGAVKNYLLVARSQPGEGLGLDAMAALKDLDWLASPLPVTPTPVHTP